MSDKSKPDFHDGNVDNLKGKLSLMWKFSIRGFVMMIILAFAFSHIMTLRIERSLLEMYSEAFDRHFSRVKKTIDEYYNKVAKDKLAGAKNSSPESQSLLKEQLSYWIKQTDLAGVRISNREIDLVLCQPDIIEDAIRKHERQIESKAGKLNRQTEKAKTSRFSLQVEDHFILPMMSKRFIVKSNTNNESPIVIQLYIHCTWIEWKLIEFQFILAIASLVLMIFLLFAAGGPVKDASQKLLIDAKRLEDAINDLEEANIELEQKTRHLVQTSKLASLGELSAAVAHEIKNPLAAISSGLQLVELQQEQDKESKSSEALKRVAAEVERLNNILSSMLRFARPSSNETITFIMAPLIEKVIVLVRKHASDHNIRITSKTKNCTEKLLGDPIQIEQVLLNLVLNSIEAIEDGGNIELTLTATKENNVVEVIDDGTGIDEENVESLFTSFSHTTKENGTGLGLSISNSIVKKHGGSLTLRNNHNKKGATATITLPTIDLVKSKPLEDEPTSTEAAKTTSTEAAKMLGDSNGI